MKRKRSVSVSLLVAVCLTVALVPLVATSALAHSGGVHWWAGRQAAGRFMQGLDDPTSIQRNPEVPLFPELTLYSYGWDPDASYDPGAAEDKTWYLANWEWVMECSQRADGACVSTLHHFWMVSDGLDDCPMGIAGMNNSWEMSQQLWVAAINAWHAGDLGWAYTQLGYAMHHVQDVTQPAHANDDTHAFDDSFEEWFSGPAATAMYSWGWGPDATAPPPSDSIPDPQLPADNSQLLNDIQNVYCWDGCGDSSCGAKVSDELEQWQGVILKDTTPVYNTQQFFYILYWADQIGNYFASDDEDGYSNDYDPIGWMGGYPDFPNVLHDEDGNAVSIHSWHGLVDNDSDCGGCTDRCVFGECDADGDLSLIATWCYGAAFKASPALIDLFRRTVDHVPPVTTVETTRADGEPVVEWNNSIVTVRLTEAQDGSNGPGARASGVWKRWGRCDGEPPTIAPDPQQTPYWAINEDGEHHVELLSTDMCGNVEGDANDFTVKVDMTPPEITFPDLRPNYLTSENFIATWEATDATSGVASEYALLDDEREVTKGEVIDLAEMAGEHWLRVIAYDVAGNYADVFYYFEVWIDANSWAKPAKLNDKTSGNGMFVVVEFPEPYDVGLIDLTTCTLAVKGTLDLTESDPVVGETAELQGELLTGVGDHDKDGIPDRMIRFNKEQFANALGGQTGDVASVVRGGLLPDGTPRFIAVVTVPVFAPPDK